MLRSRQVKRENFGEEKVKKFEYKRPYNSLGILENVDFNRFGQRKIRNNCWIKFLIDCEKLDYTETIYDLIIWSGEKLFSLQFYI